MAHHPHHDHDEPDDELSDEELGPSKSSVKRDMLALVDLAHTLAELPAQQLATIPLDEPVRVALDLARAISAHGGRKRQLKYVGKLLRHEDVEPIREALAKLTGQHAEAAAHHHLCERWRERLLAEGDAALTALLDEYPGADAQRLRQLIRNAHAEAARDKPPKSSRELFRALREIIG